MHPAIVETASRLFPDIPGPPRSVALSILDSSVGNFAPTAAIWVYGPSQQDNRALDVAKLRVSLVKTLNVYPQWAGQVVYGASDDPGVEFVVASSDGTVASVFPSLEARTSGVAAFNATSLAALNLLPETPALAPSGGRPALIVQITRYKCGGAAIALKSCHPLADAQTLTIRRFSPSDLDDAAAGDINESSPDPTLIERSRELPIYRYDWWAAESQSGCPSFMLESTKIPAHLQSISDIEYGPPIPWAEWDLTQPISNYILYFTAGELSRIWAAASTSEGRISRFDALQAHIWSALIRAHAPQKNEPFHFNLTLGIRDRLTRPLGDAFLGSPIVLARATATAATSLAQIAREIRETMVQFTPPRVAALLHEMAFDVDSCRMWAGFLGSRNAIVTSWLRLGVYEVDFGAGRPSLVHSVMPILEGVVQVMEGMPQTQAGGPWYQDGANVSVMLTDTVLEKLLADPLLRMYQ
ncbi:transferase family-domain-containing protein [Mycena amicta]|nr:transferase family-domain-containing protein [Mycena amicta]